MPRTEFRTSFTSPEGLGATDIFMCRVANVDLKNYTVDVYSQFDQMRLFSIPVGSPYLHSNRGDGASFMPEVGAKCAVCWPGDSSPPFVISFVMPHETVPLAGDSEAPGGTSERGSDNQSPTSASFAGGRPTAKPGDMSIKGRDGQYVTLHRGGVLQLGSTELSQRLYIPLRNMVLDVAENYAAYNAGGSIRWGIQEGEGESTLPTEHTQTYRVYANDKYADIRVSVGRVHSPVPDQDADAIVAQSLATVGATDSVVYEVCLAKNGFKGENGALVDNTGNLVKLRFVIDRAGNTFFRAENISVLCRKKLFLRAKEDADLTFESNLSVAVSGVCRISASKSLDITSSVIRVNGGNKPFARVGDQVSVTLPPTLLMVAPTPTGFAPIPPGLNTTIGVITSGLAGFLG